MLTETRVSGAAKLYGVMAAFDQPEPLLEAARHAHEAGYRHMDAYVPMPVEGLAEAIGFRSNTVSRLVFTGGLIGAAGGFGLMWWISVIAYPHNVAGRPLNSWPAYIPITFECMVLVACFTAVIGMLALNGLPQPHHPVFNVHRFSHASADRFFLCIESRDPKFHLADTARILQEVHAHHVTEVSDD